MGIRSEIKVLAIVATTLSCAPIARANVGEAYGFGSRTSALADAGVGMDTGAYASYDNPAALALRPAFGAADARLKFEYSLVDLQPAFKPINNVVIENNYVSNQSPAQYGNVDTSYRNTFGQAFGVSYDLFPDCHRVSFGFTAYLPLDSLGYIDNGEAFEPEYFMYRDRTQRPQFEFGLGAELGSGFYFGAGAHLAFAVTTSATILLTTNNNKPSTMRLTATEKPKLAPYFGLFFQKEEVPATFGAVVRLPVSAGEEVDVQTDAQTFGNLGSLNFNFVGLAAAYYDPLTVGLGGAWKYSETARVVFEVDREFWSGFQTSALAIQPPSTTNCQGAGCGSSFNISPGQNPGYAFQDIFVPKIGHEWAWERWALRAGYSYRPSVLKGVSNGNGNYLDPPKHDFTVGAGYRFPHFLNFDTPCVVDFHLTWDQLVTQTIAKTPGNEAGDLTDQKIGSPGYQAGGKVYGGGISLSLAF